MKSNSEHSGTAVTTVFKGERCALATMHGKEVAISPIMVDRLGLEVFVPPALDTDRFGTFSGEIQRVGTPMDAALRKCRAAIEATGERFALASEGSFGPHPSYFFLPSDSELLVLYDALNDRSIIAHHLTLETNFSASEITNLPDLEAFAVRAKFPRHALILRKAQDETEGMVKGIMDAEVLKEKAHGILERHGRLFVETDMRAMNNPTRMKAIAKCTELLAEKCLSLCPKCSAPGYWESRYEPGLPCCQCGMPTESALAAIMECQACGHIETKKFPNGKKCCDPQYCNYCNP